MCRRWELPASNFIIYALLSCSNIFAIMRRNICFSNMASSKSVVVSPNVPGVHSQMPICTSPSRNGQSNVCAWLGRSELTGPVATSGVERIDGVYTPIKLQGSEIVMPHDRALAKTEPLWFDRCIKPRR